MRVLPSLLMLMVAVAAATAKPPAPTTLPANDDSIGALFQVLHKHSSPAADPRVVAKIRALHERDPQLVDKIIAVIDQRVDWEKSHLIEVLGVIGAPAVKAIPTMVRVDWELMAKLRKAGVAVGNVPQLAVISMSKMGNAAVPELKRLVAEGNEVEAEAALFALAAMRKGDGVPLDVIEKKMRGATEDHKFIEYLMMASAMRSDYLRKPPADIQERLLKLAEAEP